MIEIVPQNIQFFLASQPSEKYRPHLKIRPSKAYTSLPSNGTAKAILSFHHRICPILMLSFLNSITRMSWFRRCRWIITIFLGKSSAAKFSNRPNFVKDTHISTVKSIKRACWWAGLASKDSLSKQVNSIILCHLGVSNIAEYFSFLMSEFLVWFRIKSPLNI